MAADAPMTPAPKPKTRARNSRRGRGLHRSPLKSRGKRTKKSGASLFPKRREPEYLTWVRTFPCAVCVASGVEQRSRTQACHLVSRGAGGGDRGNVWPGCTAHHEEQHLRGLVSFQKRYRVDLRRVAERLEVSYVTNALMYGLSVSGGRQ